VRSAGPFRLLAGQVGNHLGLVLDDAADGLDLLANDTGD